RVRGARGDARVLAGVLRRTPPEERGARLASAAKPGSYETRISAAFNEAQSAEERTFSVSDALADIDRDIDERSGWPAAAARLGAFGAMLIAGLAYLASGRWAMLLAGAAALPGIVVPIAVARRAKSDADTLRRDLDALVDALTAGEPGARAG